MKYFWPVFGLCLFFCFGILTTYYSRDFRNSSAYEPLPTTSRDPAAIKKVYDFSNLEGPALDTASKQRLISGARVVRENSDVGVELGHYVMRSMDGSKEFACQRYSKVLLYFEGDGSAVGGEKPTMEVEGHCEISADINSIAPLWIPVARILGEPVADGEFDFRDQKPIKVRFNNVSEQWPRLWKLHSVKLVDAEHPEQTVLIGDKELSGFAAKPLILEFPQ